MTPEALVLRVCLLLVGAALVCRRQLRDPNSSLSRRLDDAINSSLTTIPKDVLS